MYYEKVYDVFNYDLYKVLNSGQNVRCFRQDSTGYLVISGNSVGTVSQFERGRPVVISGDSESNIDSIARLLAVEDPEPDVYLAIRGNDFLRRAVDFSRGLRITHQVPWECLITFIISQRNSIPRIMATVNKLSEIAGSPTIEGYRYFPTPEQLSMADLTAAGLGYRLPYIVHAAYAVMHGKIDLENLTSPVCSSGQAVSTLMSLDGVGPKVASCVALFGLGHTDRFPVDVWIQRAIEEAKITESDIERFGDLSGYIQQCCFYYMQHRYD